MLPSGANSIEILNRTKAFRERIHTRQLVIPARARIERDKVKANATETGKSKAEWHALYVEAGCFNEGVNFVEREICKTKVFQKTNYNNTKEKLTGFFSKLNLD